MGRAQPEPSADAPATSVINEGEAQFKTLDANGDGQLDEAEFLAAGGDPSERSRDFRLFDADGTAGLSKEEFLAIPKNGILSARDPLLFDDPVQKLASQTQVEMERKWGDWDADASGALSKTEFLNADIPNTFPRLAAIAWEDWNKDGDEALTKEETGAVLEVAFGFRHPGGGLLRFPSGVTVNWMLFKYLVWDGDDRISRSEFLEHGFGNPDRRPQEFDGIDLDHDGSVNFQEWADLSKSDIFPARFIDPVADFLRMDADRDGFVSEAELLQGVPDWHPDLTRHIFPGFDQDEDDRLSLSEYRLTPLANWLDLWQNSRVDRDNDGLLSRLEFSWNETPVVSLSGLISEYFSRLDKDDSGTLDLDEFVFQTSRRDPRREILSRDKNGDQQLSLEEYLAAAPSGEPAGRRDFQILDVNADQQLTAEELSGLPTLFSLDRRGARPDPLKALVDQRLGEMTALWPKWDSNGDGRISREEFQRSGMNRSLAGLEMTVWNDWDSDSDGELTNEECASLLEVVYGIRRPQGELLRLSSGIVMNAMLFQHFERDADDRISLAEFQEFGFEDPKQRPAVFQDLDGDHDGFVTFQEWGDLSRPDVFPARLADPLADFLRMDADFDARVSPEELLKGMPDWHLPVTKHIFPGFDRDHDGFLSLGEYQLTPLANWIVTWHYPLTDQDGDGLLSRSEFGWETRFPLAASGLLTKIFTRLDADQSGALDLKEFEFNLDPAKAPREIVFVWKDADSDNALTFEEASSGVQPPNGDKNDAGYQLLLTQSEGAFQDADRNGDGRLDLAEFTGGDARMIVSPTGQVTTDNFSSVGASDVPEEETDWRLWGIGALNVLLVGGVGFWLLRKS